MTLRDISQILDLHESTISRITSSKYAQTPFGVYGLKYFFSNSIPSQGQGDYSSTSIKEIMKEIIENEEGKKHLSDQKIVELLHKRGIQIARRTVAKYRKDLHILPSNLRRSK
jgi:RNA polymerase sigma-54 factor